MCDHKFKYYTTNCMQLGWDFDNQVIEIVLVRECTVCKYTEILKDGEWHEVH